MYIDKEEFTIEGDFMNQEIYVYRKPERYGIENERYTQENIIEKVLVNNLGRAIKGGIENIYQLYNDRGGISRHTWAGIEEFENM